MTKKQELCEQLFLVTVPMIVLGASTLLSSKFHLIFSEQIPFFKQLSWFSISFFTLALVLPFYVHSIVKSQSIKLFLFDLSLPTISYLFFVFFYLVTIIVKFGIGDAWWFWIIFNPVISVVLEELSARAVFIKYPRMTTSRFLMLAFISSIIFSLSHGFYDPSVFQNLSWPNLIGKFQGHLFFGFALSVLIYKTKRLEYALLLHLLFNYPWVLFPKEMTSCGMVMILLNNLLLVLFVGGCSYKKIDYSLNH